MSRYESIEVRFWRAVDKRGPDECWEWTAGVNEFGYGIIRYRNRTTRAHRLSMMWALGIELEPHQFVCHKCDNPPCVNPNHLFVGSNLDNVRDMVAKGRHVAYQSTKTHCPQGHPYDEANTRFWRGKRACRVCGRAATARYRAKRAVSA